MAIAKNRSNASRAAVRSVEQKNGYHHGNLHQALLDAALALLESGGIDAVTTRACAGLAGVSVGAIRNHFPDKRALLAGLAAAGYEVLGRRRLQSMAHLKLKPALELIVENYVSFAVRHSALFRLMFADESLKRSEYTELNAASQNAYTQLRQIFESAFRREALEVTDINGSIHLIWSAMHGVAMLVIDRQFGEEMMRALPVRQRCLQLAHVLSEGLIHAHRRGGIRRD